MPPEYRDKLTLLFNKLDVNGDGVLDLYEFKLLGKLVTGVDVTEQECQAQLQRADINKDGVVDLDEFLVYSSIAFGRAAPDVASERLDTYLQVIDSLKE